MLAITFTELLLGFFVAVLYFGSAGLFLTGIWIAAYRLGGWGYNGYDGSTLRAYGMPIVGVLVAIPIASVYVLVALELTDNDGQITFSTSGGLGPDTVCWYEIVDDDQVLMAGKTPIIIDGSEKRTVCNLTPEAIPPEVKAGILFR